MVIWYPPAGSEERRSEVYIKMFSLITWFGVNEFGILLNCKQMELEYDVIKSKKKSKYDVTTNEKKKEKTTKMCCTT